jgi:hypothetical protein
MATTEYDRTNTGTFSRNQNKREGKKDADISGQINIDGRWYWLSAWQKQDKEGNVFYSAAFKPKEARPSNNVDGATQRRSAAPAHSQDDGFDEIPF